MLNYLIHTKMGTTMRSYLFTIIVMACNNESEKKDVVDVVDTDGDGVEDAVDAFPEDPNESLDTDGDGIGDNADAFPEDPNESNDTDGDGVGDNVDVFPEDPNESLDTDGDGVGDNADAFPEDDSETIDSDGDGFGDNEDAFPNNPNEMDDSDGDGLGDNTEMGLGTDPFNVDTDGDGLTDGEEFISLGTDPLQADSDGDGTSDYDEVANSTDPNDWSTGNSLRPSDGDWTFTNVTSISNTCNLSQLSQVAVGIENIIPDRMSVTSYPFLSATEFEVSFDGSSNPSSCTAGTASSFSCSTPTTQQDVIYTTSTGNWDVKLYMEFPEFNGMMNGVDSMSISAVVDVQSCNSITAILNCYIIDIYTGGLPCEVEVDLSASLN